MLKISLNPVILADAMRLKRKMTEAEFAAALGHMRPPTKRMMNIAHADLVRGVKQADIAKEYGVTKSSVSQVSKRVWQGFLKSKGYQEVSVVLPDVQVFVVREWGQKALGEINGQYPAHR